MTQLDYSSGSSLIWCSCGRNSIEGDERHQAMAAMLDQGVGHLARQYGVVGHYEHVVERASAAGNAALAVKCVGTRWTSPDKKSK